MTDTLDKIRPSPQRAQTTVFDYYDVIYYIYVSSYDL